MSRGLGDVYKRQVSHNLDQIREMCNRVVWLENHTVKMFGDVKEVCDAYRL